MSLYPCLFPKGAKSSKKKKKYKKIITNVGFIKVFFFMMSDHSTSMGDKVFITGKSESGKTKKFDYAKRPKVDLAPFGNKLSVKRNL